MEEQTGNAEDLPNDISLNGYWFLVLCCCLITTTENG